MSERPYDICPDCDRGSEALYAMRARAEAAEANAAGLMELRVVDDARLGVVYAERDAAVKRAEAAEAKAMVQSYDEMVEQCHKAAAERDKQQGMYLDAERQCSILMQERDAAVALGERLAADLEHTVDEIEQQAVRRTVNDGVPAESWRGQPAYWLGRLRSVLADARKAGWLT